MSKHWSRQGRTPVETRKEFFIRCKEIMAADNLTDAGKEKEIESEAGFFVEHIIWDFPEIKDQKKRQEAIEERYTVSGTPDKPVYCPMCGDWSPNEPAEMNPFNDEWVEFKYRKIAEFIEMARKGATA